MANLSITVEDANNLTVDVTPQPATNIVIDRGVAGNGIESITLVDIDGQTYLDIVYTNGTTAQLGPLDTGVYFGISPITVDGNEISLDDTAVTAGEYGSESQTVTYTVDTKGRLTASQEQNIAITLSQITDAGTIASQDSSNVSITGGSISGTSVSGYVPTTTTITAGTGLSGGGDLSADRTIDIENTGVTAATYGSASQVPVIAVNAQGQATSVTDTTISITQSNISDAGDANGIATLDAGGTVPLSQIPASIQGGVSYQGTWNASTNTPTLVSGVGTKGYYYVVSVAGSTNLNGVTTWNVGDWAIFNGTAWEKVDNTDAVTSVNGYTGTVVLGYGDITTGIVPVANGGTGVTVSSGANSVVLRDANVNINVNALDDGYSNIAASGTPIVLTTASVRRFTITGSGGQVIKLPDATTLTSGAIFQFDNNQSSGAITVNNNSNTLIVSVPSGGFVLVNLLSNATAAGSWDRHDQAPANVSWSTNTFDYAGSITSATWNGNVVQVNRGGTGAATLTGYVKGSGTSALTASSTIPTTDLSGTITNAQLANSAITINGSSTSLGGSVSVGTVTSVTGTSPVVSSGGNTPAISMPAATTSVNGYLTSTDWNTFNGKQPAGTYVNSVSGTATRITSTGGTTPVIDLASGVASAGTTGSSSLIPVVTIDTYGRVTSITTASNPQGTVTSVTGTSPVVSSGGATPAISMPAATTSVSGYLTSTDWNTFNGKGSGTVTSITAGTGLSGGTITGSGTIALANTAVTAGAYTNANITIDAQGRITLASSGSAGGVTSFSAGTTGLTPSTGTTGAVTLAGTLAIANGGTGQTTANTAFNALAPSQTSNSGKYLTTDGTNSSWATVNAGASLSNDTTTASNLYPIYAAATSGTPTTLYTSNAKYLYKPSTGELSASAHVSSNGIHVNNATVSASYTIASGNNGLSVGPVTVASGQSVTISTGQRWVIL